MKQFFFYYDEIIKKYESSNAKIESYSFNIFSISKYGSQLENFHSDVISEILNPDGKHGEKSLPAAEFLNYLNQFFRANIDLKDFENLCVYREIGKIDIILLDKISNKAIIIENKINGAPDMDDQLTRYHDWCVNNDYEVKSIVYLTLSGEKTAPQITSNNQIKPINISAFSNTQSDIVNGWIKPLIEKCSSYYTKSFLNQYKLLLKYLGHDKMKNEYYSKFYDLADDMSTLKKIDALKILSDDIPAFRMDKFVLELTDFSPFTKSYRYAPSHILYERFQEGDNSFKIDVKFESNGDCWVYFWNPPKNGKDAFESCQKKLKEIGFESLMIRKESPDGFFKEFLFSDFNSLKKIDNEALRFTRELMQALGAK